MFIEVVPIKRINPAPYNPRKDIKPGDLEYEKLRRSIEEYGCVEALVWNRRTSHLVGGHQRFKILKARGDTEVTVSVVDLPLDREKLLNIALNKITGAWEPRKLAGILDEIIQDADADLDLTGFSLPEATGLIEDLLSCLSGDEESSNDTEVVDAAERPITQKGDLILLGTNPARQHRLLCEDSIDPDSVARLMDGKRASLFMTDPPYFVHYTHPKRYRGKDNQAHSDWDDPAKNVDLYRRFCQTAVDVAVNDNAAWYVWHASVNQPMVHEAWQAAG
ncbi:MAG: ParB N-terminal domain-containing protein, partial [Planctomycetota bacterium]